MEGKEECYEEGAADEGRVKLFFVDMRTAGIKFYAVVTVLFSSTATSDHRCMLCSP